VLQQWTIHCHATGRLLSTSFPQRSPEPLEGVVGRQVMGREEDGLGDGAARVPARAHKAVDKAACMKDAPLIYILDRHQAEAAEVAQTQLPASSRPLWVRLPAGQCGT
jgi:hypothetical protein